MNTVRGLALLPGEWAVLGVVGLEPTHGFAIARELGPDGRLGRVWAVSRPRVYRALADLALHGLVASVAEEAGDRGPARTVIAITPTGRSALEAWLAEPVGHVRDVRSEFLLKLALLDLRGEEPRPLLTAQRGRLRAVEVSLEARLGQTPGFDDTLLRFRLASVRASAGFVDEVLRADGLVKS